MYFHAVFLDEYFIANVTLKLLSLKSNKCNNCVKSFQLQSSYFMSSTLDSWRNYSIMLWTHLHSHPSWIGWIWDLEMLLQKAIFTNVSFVTKVTFTNFYTNFSFFLGLEIPCQLMMVGTCFNKFSPKSVSVPYNLVSVPYIR